ncbi:MAG: hypothetical protein GY953_21620, partial [bacterium]|nr:hypothetical protein [bacterium]
MVFWNSRFHLDPAILGKQITVEGLPVTIVGVTPREFFGVQLGHRPRMWLTLATEAIIHLGARRTGVRLPGRLKPGVSIEQAEAEMKGLYFQTFDQSKFQSDFYVSQLTFELEPAGA